MVLCSNREEGFGPSSQLASPLPTTCFTDTIIIPLPVWLYLLLVGLLLAMVRYGRHRNYNPSTAHLRSTRRRSILRRVLAGFYYFFIAANILMQTVEVVRLCLINFGVGLIPFTYVALITGLILHATNGLGRRIEGAMWRGVNVFVWVGLFVVSAVKTAGLVKMENRGIYRTGSKYPMSDQVIDVAVMVGLYLASAVLEIWLGRWGSDMKGV